jgi:ATP-binding cassette subfamily B protein
MQPNFGFFEEDKLGDLKDIQLWRRILAYGWPQRYGLLLAILLSLTVIATGLALPHLTKIAIDGFIMDQATSQASRLEGLHHLTATFLGMVVIGFVANFFQVTVLEWSSQHIMHRLRQHLFSHLLRLDLAYFNTTPTGKLITRVTNDIQNMNEMCTSVVVTLFNDGVQFVAILVILWFMNWRLALMMVALVPLIIINLTFFSRLARDAFRAIRTRLAGINSFLQEALSGMALIQHFRREADAVANFRHQNEAYTRENLRQIRIFALFVPFIEVLSAVAIALIIWYGGGEVLRERMTFGELAAFISYMRLFFKPIREISEKYSIIQSAMASAERIFQLLDREPAILGAALRQGRMGGELTFHDIHFSYQQGEPILRGFSLTILPGETIAIVGATGSGKTTIINLLLRLYDPDQGRITVDGRDLREFDLGWLRGQIGLVI